MGFFSKDIEELRGNLVEECYEEIKDLDTVSDDQKKEDPITRRRKNNRISIRGIGFYLKNMEGDTRHILKCMSDVFGNKKMDKNTNEKLKYIDMYLRTSIDQFSIVIEEVNKLISNMPAYVLQFDLNKDETINIEDLHFKGSKESDSKQGFLKKHIKKLEIDIEDNMNTIKRFKEGIEFQNSIENKDIKEIERMEKEIEVFKEEILIFENSIGVLQKESKKLLHDDHRLVLRKMEKHLKSPFFRKDLKSVYREFLKKVKDIDGER